MGIGGEEEVGCVTKRLQLSCEGREVKCGFWCIADFHVGVAQ